jgi:hypothetical protein
VSEARGINLTRGYHPSSIPTKQEPIDLEYEPREAFMPFHERTQRWAVNVCHRRAGKTVAAVNDLIRDVLLCRLERPRAYYISPTYSQSKKVAWDYAKHYSAPEHLAKFNETELRIDYPPQWGRLQLVGADNPDSQTAKDEPLSSVR